MHLNGVNKIKKAGLNVGLGTARLETGMMGLSPSQQKRVKNLKEAIRGAQELKKAKPKRAEFMEGLIKSFEEDIQQVYKNAQMGLNR